MFADFFIMVLPFVALGIVILIMTHALSRN